MFYFRVDYLFPGDSMSHHDNSPFSTLDVDNDESRSGHCSHLYGNGGWWYVSCYDSNLNGQYGKNDKTGLPLCLVHQRLLRAASFFFISYIDVLVLNEHLYFIEMPTSKFTYPPKTLLNTGN